MNNVSIGPRLFLVLIKYTIDSYCSFKHSADTISLFSVCCLQVSNIFLEQIHHVFKQTTFEILNAPKGGFYSERADAFVISPNRQT